MMKKTLTRALLIFCLVGCMTSMRAADNMQMVYSTYLGGSSNEDIAYGIVVDSLGRPCVGGYSNSSDFPTTNAFQETYAGTYDAYVARFSADGSTLEFSTFIGGDGNEFAYDIAVDEENRIYITGYTMSDNYPVTNAFQSTRGGSADVFLTRLTEDGSTLDYSTFLGGLSNELARRLVVKNGAAYVTGYTVSTDFPTLNPYQGTLAGNYDIFLTKFSTNGQSLVFSTYFGGAFSYEEGYGIALNASNDIYLAGYTRSTDFPITNSIQASIKGGSDVFVAKFSADAQTLVYSSVIGGDMDDTGYGLAIDDEENAYVVGDTQSTSGALIFPTTSGAFQTTAATTGDSDAFVLCLAPSGTNLVYSTFLAGGDEDVGQGIVVDAQKRAYVTGYTRSTDFPVTNAFQAINDGGSADVFVTCLNASGTSIEHSTYLGGSLDDMGYDIALDSNGDVYVVGRVASVNFPVTNAFQNSIVTYYDSFLTKLSLSSPDPKTPQSALSFSPTSPQTYNTTNALSVTGGSGTGAVSYVVQSGPGMIVGGTNLLVTAGTGTVTVVATKAQDALYFSTSATGTVNAAKATQTISFTSPSDQVTTNETAIAAPASSGLPVTLLVQSGPATLSTNTAPSVATYSATGSVSVVATQLGNSNWQAAAPVTNIWNVSATPQAPLGFMPTSPQTYNTTNALSTTGGSGTGAVSYAVLSGPGVITNTTGLYASSGTGSIVVQVTKAGDSMYSSQSVSATVTVQKASQTITGFANPGTQFWTNETVIAATATSGFAVEFAVVSGPAVLNNETNGTTVTYSGAGSVSISASQTGDADWAAAPVVTNTFSVIGPQLSVLGTNGAVIVSSNVTSAADGTHFGAAIVGFETVTNVFVITNAGNATLTMGGMTINGPQVSSFSLQSSAFVLPQGGSTNVTVVFDPQVGGSNTASIVMTFNGPNSPYVVNVSGVGRGGGMALSTNALAFSGSYEGNDPSSQSVELSNVGITIYTWSNTVAYSAGASNWLSVLPANGTVETNATTSLTHAVDLSGLSAGSYTATVSILSADATNSPQTYAVSLTVGKATQTISFPNPGLQVVTNVTAISATASSGLSVSLSVIAGAEHLIGPIGPISPINLTYQSPGLVTLRATQAGNADWQAATAVEITYRVRADRVPYADFDGDGKTDLSVFHQALGDWHIIQSAWGTTFSINWGWWDTVPVPGDYDGDGKVDLAVYHQSSGDWYIVKSAAWQVFRKNWGWSVTQPVPGDYDGDGLTDMAVFHQATGDWYINYSADDKVDIIRWGWWDTIPVPGDYDGDGLTDLAVFHQPAGNWYIIQSADGSVRVKNWGWSETTPAPGDYDGDGVTDLAVYHQSSGNWYINQSNDDSVCVKNWGWGATGPVPGDYDGDGIDDLAVYYQNTGLWYIIYSADGSALRDYRWGWDQTDAPWPAWR
jgi:hypothetical protein